MDWRRLVTRRGERREENRPCPPKAGACPRGNLVESSVRLPGLTIAFLRTTELAVPHEFSVIIPRAEIRYIWSESGQQRQAEIILNSITLVDAPRHPSAGEQPPAVGGQPPAATLPSAPAAAARPSAHP